MEEHNSRTVAVWTQVVVTVVGLATIAMAVGRRDATLEQQQVNLKELQSITTDLVRSTLNLAGSDQTFAVRLTELERRLNNLETGRTLK